MAEKISMARLKEAEDYAVYLRENTFLVDGLKASTAKQMVREKFDLRPYQLAQVWKHTVRRVPVSELSATGPRTSYELRVNKPRVTDKP